MTLVIGASARRRHRSTDVPVGAGDPPTSGFQITLEPGDVAYHGAGYPVTYRFVGLTGSGHVAQWWHEEDQSWRTVPPAPESRFDGIDAARFDGTTAYISQRFPLTRDALYLRVIDSNGAEVGTLDGIETIYDARSTAVMFTYDDTNAVVADGCAVHSALQLWMTPALNSGFLGLPDMLTAAQLSAAVGAGFIEPSNHGKTHLRISEITDPAVAEDQIIGGRDGLLAATEMPWQSRGRIHSFVFPHGTGGWHNFLVESGRLVSRYTNGDVWTLQAWYEPWGTYRNQDASWKPPSKGSDTTENAQTAVDAVEYAKDPSRGYCHLYTYAREWGWESGDPWPTALAQIAAMSDIWSVGYGHWALYRRTRERATVVAL